MAWTLLVVAGLFEIGWSIGMKYSYGFTKLWPTVITILASIASFLLLSQAMRNLPVGTSYAVWTGIGTAGSVAFGIILFRESTSPARMLCIGLILAGIIGLKITMD